jgi:hypothetical protein
MLKNSEKFREYANLSEANEKLKIHVILIRNWTKPGLETEVNRIAGLIPKVFCSSWASLEFVQMFALRTVYVGL